MKRYRFSQFTTPFKGMRRMRSTVSKLTRFISIGATGVICTLALLVSQASPADMFNRNFNNHL